MKQIFVIMKKIIFVVAAVLAGQVAFAQSKGDMYVGGGLTFGAGSVSTKMTAGGVSTTDKAPAATTFTISPSFGYFVADNLRVSVSLSYGLESQKSGDTRNNTSTFLVGPEVAYYIRLADRLYYTPELGIYGGVASEAYKTGSVKESVNMGAFGIGLNIVQVEFRPTEKLGFSVNVMGLNYVNMSKKIDGVNVSANVLDFNFDASLAVRYYF